MKMLSTIARKKSSRSVIKADLRKAFASALAIYFQCHGCRGIPSKFCITSACFSVTIHGGLRVFFKVVRISGKLTQIFSMVIEVFCEAAEQGKLKCHPLC